jgi:hypothetical protein
MEIGGEDEIAVGGGGVRDGTEMDDRSEFAAIEPADQFLRRHHVRELAFAEIAPFAGTAERIVNHNIGPPGLIEAGDQIGADEAGSAGDQ